MGPVPCIGVSSPTEAFAELKPLSERAIRIQGSVRPFGPADLTLDRAPRSRSSMLQNTDSPCSANEPRPASWRESLSDVKTA